MIPGLVVGVIAAILLLLASSRDNRNQNPASKEPKQ